MTLEQLAKLCEDLLEKKLEFEDIPEQRKLCNKPDLNGMLLLHKLDPANDSNLIVSSEHDLTYFSVDPETVAENASIEDIQDLVCCGIYYDEHQEGFFRCY